MSKPLDAVTVVIPVHDATDALGKILPGWRLVLQKCGRAFEILVVDDGTPDAGAVARTATREPNTRVLRHETRQGYGACLRTALDEAKHPLFFYTAVDYPYVPSDLRKLLDRIDLRDDILGKPPDLVSGCRTGIPTPPLPRWSARAWALFWRAFAGMPIPEPAPWHGWPAFWHKTRAHWVYGVPLVDVNSCFKLFRTAFLKRFPIQSDGDFVHTELVAKATFLTSIMDEVPLTPKPDPVPLIGDTRADRQKLSPTRAKFTKERKSETPAADAHGSPVATPVAGAPGLPVVDSHGSPALPPTGPVAAPTAVPPKPPAVTAPQPAQATAVVATASPAPAPKATEAPKPTAPETTKPEATQPTPPPAATSTPPGESATPSAKEPETPATPSPTSPPADLLPEPPKPAPPTAGTSSPETSKPPQPASAPPAETPKPETGAANAPPGSSSSSPAPSP
jgi:hypothetical protein